MKRLAKHIGHFMLSNNIWIFFTGILFTSIVLVFQTDQQEWLVYFSLVGKISLLFAPVLLFCGCRKWLRKHLPLVPFILLWSFSFLAYPYSIELLGWQKITAIPNLDKVALRLTGTWFLVAELVIQLNHYWLEGKVGLQWTKRLSLEKGILLFTALFAVFYATIWFFISENNTPAHSVSTFLFYTFQIFIILLIYYGFYWINHYFLIDKLLKQKGLIYYSFGLIATIVAFYPLASQLIFWLPMVRQTDIHPVHNGRIFEEINALVPLLGMLFSIPFILAIKWFRQNNELITLARERSETELNLLKQQVNPHFFFNTLNNLYALSITQDKRTPEVIMQLSELMRYVIYKGKEDSVTLAEEVKYIEDFLRLQEIRLHKQFDLQFEKEISDEKQQVPPLLFITLVENAFKHGIEPAAGACFLHLYLKSDAKNVCFICENTFEEKANKIRGIGLDNLKRRLALRFPGRHEFRVEEGPGVFKATLKFTL